MGEPWGAALYGDPCGECGFVWSIEPSAALDLVAAFPHAVEVATACTAGVERQEGWSVAEYVSHVADNLRQWAERVQAARLAGTHTVAGYDQDDLARARRYEAIPLPVAVWSLKVSASAWVEVMRAALAEGVDLQHETRGRQAASDIARNNAHDATHHLWDIRRILD